MDYCIENLLRQAESAKRFEHVDCQVLEVPVFFNQKNKKMDIKEKLTSLNGRPALSNWLESKVAKYGLELQKPKKSGFEFLGGLRLLIQTHGHSPDYSTTRELNKLPFGDRDIMQNIFDALKLPQTYILALDHAKGVADCPASSPELSYRSLDFIAQDIMYDHEPWSLALSNNPTTGVTMGFLRADGRHNEETLFEDLKKPRRAININGMKEQAEKSGRRMDVDFALQYLKSSKPQTSVEGAIKSMKDLGIRCDIPNTVQYLQECGFQVAPDVLQMNSLVSNSDLDVEDAIKFQTEFGLHHDLAIISDHLKSYRSKIDVADILRHLIASKEKVLNPLLLPAIMYQGLKVSSERHLKALYDDLSAIEQKLGHVPPRGGTIKTASSNSPVLAEDKEIQSKQLDPDSVSHRLNKCKKDQASRDGRYQFRSQFYSCLKMTMGNVQESFGATASDAPDGLAKERAPLIIKSSHQLEQWISLNTSIFEFEKGRDENVRTRIAAQLGLLYSLISQKQGKSQEEIAQSTAEDSKAMKDIASLGYLFLPISLMAAIFEVKDWQMGPMAFLKFSIATAVLFGLVAISLLFRSLWNYSTGQREAVKRNNFGIMPKPKKDSSTKSGALEMDIIGRSRSESVSTDARV